jgi:hypothetical protein
MGILDTTRRRDRSARRELPDWYAFELFLTLCRPLIRYPPVEYARCFLRVTSEPQGRSFRGLQSPKWMHGDGNEGGLAGIDMRRSTRCDLLTRGVASNERSIFGIESAAPAFGASGGELLTAHIRLPHTLSRTSLQLQIWNKMNRAVPEVNRRWKRESITYGSSYAQGLPTEVSLCSPRGRTQRRNSHPSFRPRPIIMLHGPVAAVGHTGVKPRPE